MEIKDFVEKSNGFKNAFWHIVYMYCIMIIYAGGTILVFEIFSTGFYAHPTWLKMFFRYTCVDVDCDTKLCSEPCRVIQLFVGHGLFMLFTGHVQFL